MKRKLYLDICDYNNVALCNLYDNSSVLSGQATDVFVRTERNGWKELSFTIPSVMFDGEKEVENFRLDYLISDYRIRLEDDYEVDYYLISEKHISHNAFSKTVTVTAGHISQLLKTKNLSLEFSDEEGNNVGTPQEFLETILAGTKWTAGEVAVFYEDDGQTIKRRTLQAASKTGAFKMISDMCELFDAKATYHGDTLTVDITPLNPFSREIKYVDGKIEVYGPITLEQEEIPEAAYHTDVIEMHYDKNIKGISKVQNTENLVTKFYAYGSHGDAVDGICSLQEVEHAEYKTTISGEAGQEYRFTLAGLTRYFKLPYNADNSELIFSLLDLCSRSYIWDDKEKFAIKLYDTPETHDYIELTEWTAEKVQNYFSSLFGFDYYDEVGLFTDEHLQEVAKYQRDMPAVIKISNEAAEAWTKKEGELSEIGESNSGFLKLDVESYGTYTDSEIVDGLTIFTSYLKVNIKKSEEHEDGVIYRTDYDEKRRNYFSWYVAQKLKANGDPVSSTGSVLFIVHDTDPVTWEKIYVRQIDERWHYEGEGIERIKVRDNFHYDLSEGDPSFLVMWADPDAVPVLSETDRIYLFCSNSMSGYLGAKQVSDESVLQTLESTTKVASEPHPTYFEMDISSPSAPLDVVRIHYGWDYIRRTNSLDLGKLYFCYGEDGDTSWHRAYCQDAYPDADEGDYFFSTKYKKLYRFTDNEWIHLDTTEDKRVATSFSKVNYYCLRRDMLYKGLYDKYTYLVEEGRSPIKLIPATGTSPAYRAMPVGNYAFSNQYGFYWTFTTDANIRPGNTIWVDTSDNNVHQSEKVTDIVEAHLKPYENIVFPPANILEGVNFRNGTIDSDGVEQDSKVKYRSYNIQVYPNVSYEFNVPSSSVFFYDNNNRFLGERDVSAGVLTMPSRASYIRMVSDIAPDSSHYVRVEDYQNKLFVEDKQYIILSPVEGTGLLKGIDYLTKKFADLADETYGIYLQTMLDAQKEVNRRDKILSDFLGDMYREGWWQEPDYVDGDEDKLYKDAMDNLREVSKPETTYDIEFLDLYGSSEETGISVDEDRSPWPDIHVTDAVHLIDNETDINLWAYVDMLNKCYDKPWETTLTINTKLSLIGQHEFSDVMSMIADVANQTKANQDIYQRASNITPTGQLAAEKLEGALSMAQNTILGGASNYHTDDNGNIILEDADGNSAMMVTGSGILVADTKNGDGDWIWRTAITGKGLSADVITTGVMSAQYIEAGTITADKLMAGVGQTLDISSNVALMLLATTNGSRPAGGVYTPTVTDEDSYIEIGAKQGDDPAYINIMTGGRMNVFAGSELNIQSGGSIHIQTAQAGYFTVTSPNFNVYADGSVSLTGTITAEDGYIGGWHIGQNALSSGSGSNHVELNSGGTYAIFAGAESPSSAKFYVKNDGTLYASTGTFSGTVDAGTITGGTISGATISGNTITGGTISGAAVSGNTISGGTISATSISATDISGGTISGTTITGSSINNGTGTFSVDKNGNLTATSATINGSITSGSSITGATITGSSINNGNGTFTVDSSGNLKATSAEITGSIKSGSTITGSTISGGSISIANGTFAVDTSGNLTATSATINGSITSGSTITGATITGSSINNGSGTFKVDSNGNLTATSATINGSITSGSTITGATISGGSINIANGTFKVDTSGNLTATSATINGSITSGSTISGATISGGSINIASGTFKVDTSGNLTATSATIKGTVQSGSTIACEISADKITSGSMSAARITSGTMSADRISGGSIDATNVTITNLNADNITSGHMSANKLSAGTIDASVITVANINADNITSGHMSADKLSAGTIDASVISVINLSADNITSGTISANKISGGSIDASNVTITNINASNITSGTISADKISGGSIDANNVTITNINASNITSGTISADKISGGTLSGSVININSGKFKVDESGKVYASKFISVDESDRETEINLSSQPLWRLSRCVKTLSSDGTTLTIELYNGTSVNFKKAATAILSGGWSGSTFTVKAINDPNVHEISEAFTYDTGEGNLSTVTTRTINTFNAEHKAWGEVKAPSHPLGVLVAFNVDATTVYNKGWGAPTPNVATWGTRTYSNNIYNVPVTIRCTNGNENTFTGTFIATEAYNAGWNAALDACTAVTVYTAGTWYGTLYKAPAVGAPATEAVSNCRSGQNQITRYTLPDRK